MIANPYYSPNYQSINNFHNQDMVRSFSIQLSNIQLFQIYKQANWFNGRMQRTKKVSGFNGSLAIFNAYPIYTESS